MKRFFVPRDLLLYSHEMGIPSNFAIRGFSGGLGEDISSITFQIMTDGAIEFWTPAEIITALWLDAADSSTITLSATKVTQWSDKSGNGRHLIQGTDSLRPTLGTNKIVFGGSHWLQNATAKLPLSGFVLGVVFRETTAVVNSGVLSIKGSTNDYNSTDGLVFGPSNKTTSRCICTGSTSSSLQLLDTASPSAPCPFAVYTVEKSVAVGSFYRDGNLLATDTSFTAFSSTSLGGIVIGARQTPAITSPYLKGEIMEIVYAPSVDRQKLEGYLAHKWDSVLDVTTSVDALPSDHPYKSAAPTL